MKMYVNLGLINRKVHSVSQSTQNNWLTPYIVGEDKPLQINLRRVSLN